MNSNERCDTNRWKRYIANARAFDEVCVAAKADFHMLWTVQGPKIREEIDDDAMLARLLWQLLPTYAGQPIELYRGENLARWQSGKVGFCWSSDIAVARMFARGLNSVQSGGLLLKIFAGTKSIIAGPSAHSQYLHEFEYTVDPQKIGELEVAERFPALT